VIAGSLLPRALPQIEQAAKLRIVPLSTRSANWETTRLSEWCNEVAPVHWVRDAEEPPSWAEAHRRLQEEGRRSSISQPSEAQRRFEIREPGTSRRTWLIG
jgi:hypothetical protein